MTRPTLEDLLDTLRSEADDVCTGAELMGRLHRSRRSRATFIAVAAGIAAAVVVTLVFALRHAPTRQPIASPGSPKASTTSLSPPPPTDTRVALHSQVPAYVTIPSGWSWSRFSGRVGTISTGLIYVSDQKLSPQCVDTAHASCVSPKSFPASWRTPATGVLVVWGESYNPTIAIPSGGTWLHAGAGFDGFAAAVTSGKAGRACPLGSSTEIQASVAMTKPVDPGVTYDMTACMGPDVSQSDRHEVVTMLHSLDIRPRSARVAVPDVIGVRWKSAEAILRAAGFDSRVTRERGFHARPGTVVFQYPRAKDSVAPGTIVGLSVEK